MFLTHYGTCGKNAFVLYRFKIEMLHFYLLNNLFMLKEENSFECKRIINFRDYFFILPKTVDRYFVFLYFKKKKNTEKKISLIYINTLLKEYKNFVPINIIGVTIEIDTHPEARKVYGEKYEKDILFDLPLSKISYWDPSIEVEVPMVMAREICNAQDWMVLLDNKGLEKINIKIDSSIIKALILA